MPDVYQIFKKWPNPFHYAIPEIRLNRRQFQPLISRINIHNYNDTAIYKFFPIDKNAIARLDIRLI